MLVSQRKAVAAEVRGQGCVHSAASASAAPQPERAPAASHTSSVAKDTTTASPAEMSAPNLAVHRCPLGVGPEALSDLGRGLPLVPSPWTLGPRGLATCRGLSDHYPRPPGHAARGDGVELCLGARQLFHCPAVGSRWGSSSPTGLGSIPRHVAAASWRGGPGEGDPCSQRPPGGLSCPPLSALSAHSSGFFLRNFQ